MELSMCKTKAWNSLVRYSAQHFNGPALLHRQSHRIGLPMHDQARMISSEAWRVLGPDGLEHTDSQQMLPSHCMYLAPMVCLLVHKREIEVIGRWGLQSLACRFTMLINIQCSSEEKCQESKQDAPKSAGSGSAACVQKWKSPFNARHDLWSQGGA